MAKILQFPQPGGYHAVSLDLFIEPDGSIAARISDMNPAVIERMNLDTAEMMQKIALWTQKAASNLAEQADALRLTD